MSNSRFTYVEPKDKFKKINMDIILKYEPYIVGVYCKLATMSSGKSFSIDFLSKKLGISKERMRKAIVLLENDGYITREPLTDARGRMAGWHYSMYAIPVGEQERTHAGLKKQCDENRVMEKPCYGKTDNTEKWEHINIDNNISINKIDNIDNIDNVPCGTSRTPEEETFIKKMKEKFPRIMRMEQPLTLEQAKKLKGKYDSDLIYKIMSEMENWKPLLKNRVSANLTINEWCQRELDRQ